MPHEYPAVAHDDDDVLHYTGSYPVNQQHQLDGLLDKSLQQFEAAAQKVAIDLIHDAQTRQEYMRQISEIPKLVRTEVASGHVGLEEAVRFAQTMRNQVMKEARAATSAGGLALAERHKKEGLTERFLLERYSVFETDPAARRMPADELKAYVNEVVEGRRPSVFRQLTAEQRAKVYYAIIDASGRDSVKFTNFCVKFAAVGKVFTAMTAILAVHAVATAKDKVYEVNRQAAIFGGSLLGSALGGAAVSTVCGPGAPVCAFVLIAAGGLAGANLADKGNELYQAELREFMKWQIR
jgi:hypothetical protein